MNRRAYNSIAAIMIVLGLMLCAAPRCVLADDPLAMHQSAIPADQIPPYLTDAINSPARPTADRESDASRQPAQVMAFFGIKPGMQVADLWAGGGATTELLARIVGPTGKVYSQNTAFPEKFKKNEAAWKDRLKEPGMSNVVEVTKPFGAPDMIPVPPNTLDVVLINLNYHDLLTLAPILRSSTRSYSKRSSRVAFTASSITARRRVLARATPTRSIASMRTS
jgi:predicted methyltransferase